MDAALPFAGLLLFLADILADHKEPFSKTSSPVKSNNTFPSQPFCWRYTYLELLSEYIKLDGICVRTPSTLAYEELVKASSPETSRKFVCAPLKTDNDTEPRTVKVVSSAELQQGLGTKNDTNGVCSLVIFFAPWCMFCARVAPHFNAMARAFPQMNVFAIDAVNYSNLNSRYGTIAVPTILLFHNAKPVSRFNNSERTFETISSFVSTNTGLKVNASVQVEAQDYEGPLPSTPTKDTDPLLWLSWIFTITCGLIYFAQSSLGQRLLAAVSEFGREHRHLN